MKRSGLNAVSSLALAACVVAGVASEHAAADSVSRSHDGSSAYLSQRESPERMQEIARAQSIVTKNKEAVRLNPNDAQAHKALGEAHLVLEEYENAFESFKQVIRITPSDAEAYRGIGEAYERVWQYARARDFYQEAVRRNPRYGRAQTDLGNMYVKLFQYPEAIVAINEGIRLKPSGQIEYVDYYNLGEAYLRTGKHQDALGAYQNAQKLRPDSAPAHTGIASAYIGLKQYENAISSAQRALKELPNDRMANLVLGDTYLAMEQYEKAAEFYKESIRVSSNRYQVEALLGLGNAHNSLGRYQEALVAFEKGVAYASTPKQFAAEEEIKPWLLSSHYFGLAQANLNLGRGAAAAAASQKFIELRSWADSNAPYAALMSYFGYRKSGRSDDARKVLSEASGQLANKAWPYPVFLYLRGELTSTDLLGLATDTDKMTEARAYVGMHLALAGRLAEARAQLEWVVKNGNRHFIEYALSQSELRSIASGNSSGILAPGNPPLTREVSDVVAEFLAFIVTESTGKTLVADQQFKDAWAQLLAARYSTRSTAEQERLSHVPALWASIRASWPQKREEERAKLREEWRTFLGQGMSASQTKEQIEAEKSLKALQTLIQLGQQRPLQPLELGTAADHMDVVATGLLQLGDEQSVEAAAQMTKMAQSFRAAAQQGTPVQTVPSKPTDQTGQQTDPNGALRMIQRMNNNHFTTMNMIQFMSRRF